MNIWERLLGEAAIAPNKWSGKKKKFSPHNIFPRFYYSESVTVITGPGHYFRYVFLLISIKAQIGFRYFPPEKKYVYAGHFQNIQIDPFDILEFFFLKIK